MRSGRHKGEQDLLPAALAMQLLVERVDSAAAHDGNAQRDGLVLVHTPLRFISGGHKGVGAPAPPLAQRSARGSLACPPRRP